MQQFAKKYKMCLVFLLALVLALMSGCGRPEDLDQICLEIANVYRDIYRTAKAEADGAQLSAEAVDAIEDRLIESGYMVVDTRQNFPSVLANAENFYSFLKQESDTASAFAAVIRVENSGGFSLGCYSCDQGQRYYEALYLKWDSKQEPYIAERYQLPVYDWFLTEEGSFFYRLHRSDIHGTDYNLLRLQPVDEANYALAQKYIAPVGYIQNNMFFTNWTEDDTTQLHFPDVFDRLYEMKNGEAFDKYAFSYSPESFYYRIPAGLFEETVSAFFSTDPAQVRASAIDWEGERFYPYSGMYLDYSQTPDLTPVVKDCVAHDDGTITLTVWVESMEKATDCLFSHALTIRPQEDGGFQYVSNQILSGPEEGLPVPKNRLAYNRSTKGGFEIHVGGRRPGSTDENVP